MTFLTLLLVLVLHMCMCHCESQYCNMINITLVKIYFTNLSIIETNGTVFCTEASVIMPNTNTPEGSADVVCASLTSLGGTVIVVAVIIKIVLLIMKRNGLAIYKEKQRVTVNEEQLAPSIDSKKT